MVSTSYLAPTVCPARYFIELSQQSYRVSITAPLLHLKTPILRSWRTCYPGPTDASIQSQFCLIPLFHTNPKRERTAKMHSGWFPTSFTLAHTSASAFAIRSLSTASCNCSSLFRISAPISVCLKRKKKITNIHRLFLGFPFHCYRVIY